MKSGAGFLICLVLVSSSWAAEPNAIRDKLTHNTAIQGVPCGRGYAWFYPSGALNQCSLSGEWKVADARLPKGSIVVLRPDGTVHHVMLSRETVIGGYPAEGGGWLGPGEGVTTAFYPRGQLQSLYLAKDQIVEGVPCQGNAWSLLTDPVGDGGQVEFDENGRLRSCKLSRNYEGALRGQRIVMPERSRGADDEGDSGSH
jgi:hypothetical protein